MHAPGKAHVVGVVVQHDHAQRPACGQGLGGDAALDQRPTQVVEVATAHQGRAMRGGQLRVERRAELRKAAQAAAKAHLLLPVLQRQAQLAGQGPHRAIHIQHDRLGIQFCSLHWRSLSKWPAKRRPSARSSGIADEDRMLREGEAGAQLGLDLGVGPAGHVVAQAAFDGVFKVDHPAHEVEIGLARGRVGQADVLVDQLAVVLEAQVPAQQRAGRAVVLQRAVLEHGASVACIAQQGREEIAREFVEVDLALRIHRIEQRVVGIDAGVIGKGRARGNALHLQLRAAPELAAQVLAAAPGQARKVFVQAGEVRWAHGPGPGLRPG